VREFDVLEFLMRNAGRPVSRGSLMEQVWNMPFDPSTNVVDVYAFQIAADEARVGVCRNYVWVRLNRDGCPTDLVFSNRRDNHVNRESNPGEYLRMD
jgi:Transcriptional regulatory protein, C terminal